MKCLLVLSLTLENYYHVTQKGPVNLKEQLGFSSQSAKAGAVCWTGDGPGGLLGKAEA